VEIGPGIHGNLTAGALLRVESFARASADAVGTSVIDQGMAYFKLDRGFGYNPNGPRLVVYLP
jgi:hypothetical protein